MTSFENRFNFSFDHTRRCIDRSYENLIDKSPHVLEICVLFFRFSCAAEWKIDEYLYFIAKRERKAHLYGES